MRKIFLIFLAAVLASCAAQQKISYFQDIEPDSEFSSINGKDITVMPGDEISIVVSSKNPELALLFNLPKVQQSLSSNSSSSDILGYTINSQGKIDFPILGEISVAGKTKEEITALIKNSLITQDLVKDPVVTVGFTNLKFSVLGEVSRPGQYNLTKNKTSILEALSMAGDLTIHGVRDKVYLTRETDGKKVTYKLDMRSKDIYNSPAYYVRQNDLIYVEPNRIRANQSTVNGNTFESATFWMSLVSFLTTMTLLFIN